MKEKIKEIKIIKDNLEKVSGSCEDIYTNKILIGRGETGNLIKAAIENLEELLDNYKNYSN